jgi:hypothetical protein
MKDGTTVRWLFRTPSFVPIDVTHIKTAHPTPKGVVMCQNVTDITYTPASTLAAFISSPGCDPNRQIISLSQGYASFGEASDRRRRPLD